MSRTWVVRPPQGSSALDVVVSTMGDVDDIAADGRLPLRLGRAHRRLGRSFTATPQPLIDSWRVARLVAHRTLPGDTVVFPAARGVAGVTAVEQWARPPDARRRTVVVADDGVVLRAAQLTGRTDGLDGDAEAASGADWEVAAYRYADEVVTTSPRAAQVLAELGVGARLVVSPRGDRRRSDLRAPRTVWVPEPVSREAQTPVILRAVAAARAAGAEVSVAVGTADTPDRFWTGTTWEAMAGVRAVLGDALGRADDPPEGALVVLGDPYAEAPQAAVRAHAGGHALAAAAGSAAAARWPDAAVWSDESELTAILLGAPRPSEPLPSVAADVRHASPAPDRARRVAAAIPVFRDVRFLDDAVASLVAQTQPIHEILLVDDGSGDPAVEAALDAWARRDPRVRVLRQPNRGVCAARNLALEEMTGDAFVLLDQDDVLESTFVEACATVLRSRRDLWAVATWTEFFGAYEGVEAKPPFDARVGRRENPIVSTCALVDMHARDVGLRFAEDLAWIYCEDWDFWARIVAAGGAFGLVPRPLARHRVHPRSGGHHRTPLALAAGKARATAHLEGLGPAR